jgi:hypothetical protein
MRRGKAAQSESSRQQSADPPQGEQEGGETDKVVAKGKPTYFDSVKLIGEY